MLDGVVAIAGASGFVGRRLARRLAADGATVRCLARRPQAIEQRPGLEVVQVDLTDEDGLADALLGARAAYYLVHNLEAEGEFATLERAQAESFGRACRRAGVQRVIYLGGLYPDDEELSQHLGSRREVGDVLRRECGALVVRAGIIIGAGSASFEIMRDLAARLPVMVAPRWVGNRCQAVHIDDVIETLTRAIDVVGDREVDIAGPETLTYGEMLRRLGQALGRRPAIIPVPVLTPQLSSHWLRFITAVPLPVARSLVASLRHEALASRPDLCAEVGVRPRSFTEAVARTVVDAARPRVSEHTEERYEGDAVWLDQSFEVAGVDWQCDPALLGRLDAALFRATARAVPFVRWSDSRISLGRVTLISLSALRFADDRAAASRSVTGGLLSGASGGEMTFSCVEGQPSATRVQLHGFVPRLPRFIYRPVQQGLHRRLVRAAVRTVARDLS